MFGKNGQVYLVRLGLVLFIIVVLSLAGLQSTRPAADTTAGGAGPLAPVGGARSVPATHSNGNEQPKAVVSTQEGVLVGHSSKNMASRPLRDITPLVPHLLDFPREEESRNEKIPIFGHKDTDDPVVL